MRQSPASQVCTSHAVVFDTKRSTQLFRARRKFLGKFCCLLCISRQSFQSGRSEVRILPGSPPPEGSIPDRNADLIGALDRAAQRVRHVDNNDTQ